MSFQLVTLFQSADDPDLTAERLVAQIREDWADHLDPAQVQLDDIIEAGRILSVRIEDKRVGVFQMTDPFAFDVEPLVETSRLLHGGAPNTQGPYFVVSVVPDDEIINALTEDEFVDQGEMETGEELADARLISMVIASLVGCTDTIAAALFHTASQLVSADIVRDTVIEFAPLLPVLLWAEFGVGPHPDSPDEFGGYTSGLDSLGLLDVVVPKSGVGAPETVELLIGVALKQCAEEAPLEPGITLETDAGYYAVDYAADPDDLEETELILLTPVASPN